MAAESMSLFPLSYFWPHYLGFCAFVVFLLALDLGVFHKEPHKVSFKESAAWSVVWITLAMIFNVALYYFSRWHFETHPELLPVGGEATKLAKQISLEFLTGYLVEKSLSVDNLFVFAVVFSYFGIPAQYQHRVLFFGILGAIIFRAIFIALGAILMQYHIVVIILGVFLIFTGIKMAFSHGENIDPSKNPLIKWLGRALPVTNEFHGQNLFVRLNGKLWVTPLFIALAFIEMTDVVFALDSVPAIFAITKEPLIVFTSNIFAILGLRALYFMLANVLDKFYLLKFGLAFVLVFVGAKMAYLNSLFPDNKFPILWSLAIIGVAIGSSIALSFAFPQKKAVEDLKHGDQ